MCVAQVRGQDRQPVEVLHALQQVGDLDVGVAVAGVLDLAAPAEQRVCLVEEQDSVGRLGLREHSGEVLLGLPDVLIDDRREVDPVEVELERGGDHAGRHRLAGPARPGEQRRDPRPRCPPGAEAPLPEDRVAVP